MNAVPRYVDMFPLLFLNLNSKFFLFYYESMGVLFPAYMCPPITIVVEYCAIRFT